MENNIFLSLGSNIGKREFHLREAVRRLQTISSLTKISSIYETEPWGVKDLAPFLNLVCQVKSVLPPVDLLERIHEIERNMGRKRRQKCEARIIDIDIIFYGGIEIEEPGLTIPHPEYHKRRFVLQPVAEIAPDFSPPSSVKTIAEILSECSDTSQVIKYKNWG